jgi:hypothetical protein
LVWRAAAGSSTFLRVKWDESPWAAWNLPYTTRDGYPTLAESTLWELELRHPKAILRRGDDVYLRLDRLWRVVRHPQRAFMLLVPAEEPVTATQPEPTAAAGGTETAAPAKVDPAAA